MRVLSRLGGVLLFLALAGPPIPAWAQRTDPSFNPGVNGPVLALATQSDGKILIGGQFTGVGGGTGATGRLNIARINADGSLDDGFNPGANGRVMAIAVQADHRILVAGEFTGLGGGTGATERLKIGRLNPDGSVDESFNPGLANGAFTARIVTIVLQPDGQILVGGQFTGIGGGTGATPRLNLARLNHDGSVDGSFNPGAAGYQGSIVVSAMAVEPNGDIVVGGQFTGLGGGTGATPRLNIGRVDETGVVDNGFDPGVAGPVFSLVRQPDGRLLVAGGTYGIGGGTGTEERPHLARLNGDGTVDVAFAPDFSPGEYMAAFVDSIALQADGQIIVGLATGFAPHRYRRLNATDGSIDSSFFGFSHGEILALALDSDGQILVGGGFSVLGCCGLGIGDRLNIGRLSNPTAPSQSLTVSPDGSTITWERAGSLPEVTHVRFATSTDGVTYSDIGAGSRVAGKWELTGLSIVSQPGMRIRARGWHSSGIRNGSGSVVVAEVPVQGQNFVENGTFGAGTSGWLQFGLPDMSGIVSNVAGGVFQFYRSGTQAVVFQQTGMPLPGGAPVTATFDLGNSDPVRKRISVLLHDQNFGDLSVCTFWLPANSPMTGYSMVTHTTRTWAGATISLYAASTGSSGGFYQVDNVSLQYTPAIPAVGTACIDATAPSAPGGAVGPDLLVNGNFASGAVAPGWSTFGQIQSQVSSGVFEFIRLAGAPAGVVLQATAETMEANEILTATFQLGNSSNARKRVTVILHDNNFADLSACTFWLSPGQPLSTYAYRTFATQAWTDATFSVYPATVGAEQWIRFDNATLQRTPGAAIVGTECIEPSAVADALADGARSAPSLPFTVAFAPPTVADGDVRENGTTRDDGPESGATREGDWLTDGFEAGDAEDWQAVADASGRRILQLAEPVDLTGATIATLRLRSWLSGVMSRAYIEVSVDGSLWAPVHVVAPSDTWMPLAIDLSAWVGTRLHVRFVFDAVAPSTGAPADVWRIEEVDVEVD